MSLNGLLIDYEYCSGCHTCEVACQMEHGFAPGQSGIKIAEIGPWEMPNGKWQYAYVPAPTEQCDLCDERVAAGKQPACVHHCQANVMEFGDVDELARKLGAKQRQVIFVP